MKDRIRIKDIALHAGVSPGTVDRVLHKRGNVSQKSKEKVLLAIEAMDYSPNVLASALAYNKTWNIAVLIPSERKDPFWNQPKEGILKALKVLKDYGVNVNFYHFPENNVESYQKQCEKILSGNYQSVIVSPIFKEESLSFLKLLDKKGLPFVQINTCLEMKSPNWICYIGQDSYHSGTLGAKLLGFGLSSGDSVLVSHLEESVYNSQHLIDKENGFKDYFAAHQSLNINVVVKQYFNPYDEQGLAEFYANIFEQYPNIKGIFITTSRVFHAVNALKMLGRTDIKIVGFDLIDENIEYLNDESIDFLINQNPVNQGYQALFNVFNYLIRKIQPTKLQYLSLDVAMKENVHYYVNSNVSEMPIVV